jgi:hypothetical protein
MGPGRNRSKAEHDELLEKHSKRFEFSKKLGIFEISKAYKNYVDPNFFTMDSVKHMILLKLYLESKGLDYFFCKAAGKEESKFKKTDLCVNVFKELSKDANWLDIPNFREWAEINNFSIGLGSHPLEDAHKVYTEEFIIPYLKSKGYGDA